MRFYIVPKIGAGTRADPYRPKYLDVMGVEWSAMDYGRENTMLAAADLSGADHTTLAANLDVTAIPQNLDSNISAGALGTVQDRVEDLKIPGNWLTTSHTYRDVVRIVGKIFVLMQRFDGLRARTFFDSGITLATQVNELTAGQRADLQEAATSLGIDVSGVTGGQTLRQVFRNWVEQMPSFHLGGEVF